MWFNYINSIVDRIVNIQSVFCMPLTLHKDMLFGVGLGCLLQMFQNNNVVMVCLTLYTQCMSGCYLLYNLLAFT